MKVKMKLESTIKVIRSIAKMAEKQVEPLNIKTMEDNKPSKAPEHYKECLINILEGLECREIDFLLTNGEPSDYRRLGVTMADKIKTIISENN